MNTKDEDDVEDWGDERAGDFAVDSQPPDGFGEEEKPRGPPEKYRVGSWYDRARADWWFDGLQDPCPVRPLGHNAGNYAFVTPQGELRKFTAAQLHRGGGLADLFAARLWWLTKHFPGFDKRTGEPTKRPNAIIAAEAMMRACVDSGYISSDVEHRLAGTWRGPDGRPVVHCGDALIVDGEILRPGTRLGAPLYVIAGRRPRPALERDDRGVTRFAQVPAALGQSLVGAILNWSLKHDGSAELICGFIAQAIFGDATVWRSHLFLRARPGAGKSTLLRLIRAALGGAAQEISLTYSGPGLEQEFLRQACAIILDENESDTDPTRMKKVTELIRLLSDQDGARGSRGTPGGEVRKLDLRGAVCMAATTRGNVRQADRTRVSIVDLEKLEAEEGRPLPSEEMLAALIQRVDGESALVRARMLGNFDLFQENLRRARKRIAEMGGSPRDGNQLGHLIAGWWTLTHDSPADDAMVADVSRFSRWILTLADAEEGTDPANECWNRMLGEDAHVWRGGETLTVGQVIARARGAAAGESYRRAMLGMGLRLLPADPKEKNPHWPSADLGIANKAAGLDKVFAGSDWSDGRWAEVLPDLEFQTADGKRVKVSLHGPVRFGGPQSRGVLVPAAFLPSLEDEEP